jgi:hypothetical protein
LPHFLLGESFADHATLDAVKPFVDAVEDAVGVGFDLGVEVRSDLVRTFALIDVLVLGQS